MHFFFFFKEIKKNGEGQTLKVIELDIRKAMSFLMAKINFRIKRGSFRQLKIGARQDGC